LRNLIRTGGREAYYIFENAGLPAAFGTVEKLKNALGVYGW
jgi:hypothetical protein